ncbi:MAG TPA: Ku protein [Steroidobacteraceae bacterium]|nr:Ku protein [Steroidobacteraceae bacterium]
MARALWRGAISFGLVYLPIEVHTASRENPLPLHMLDSRDFAPVGYRHINKRTGKEVDWKNIVKGYEYRKGDYVVLTEADFQHANVKASETIEIQTFCDAAAIAPLYFAKPYYLTPAKGGAKVYLLLRQALIATGKVAVGSFVMHQRQHLCAIAPTGSALTLLTLRFQDEIVPMAAIEAGAAAKVTPAELTMAKQLVNQMSGKFEPSHFKDTYRSDLKHRVQEKVRRKQTHELDVAPPAGSARPKAPVIDLMEALKASLARKAKASSRTAVRRHSHASKRA